MKNINANQNINNIKNNIFREFNKKNDTFIATNNFYISEKTDNDNFIFNNINNNNNETIFPFNNNKDIGNPTNSEHPLFFINFTYNNTI